MNRKTGVVVPLAALYTKECPAVGDFLALKPFADFCAKSGLGIIQLLPVNDTGTHSSPYSGLSAYALHPLYIRIDALPEFEDAYKNCKPFATAYRAFNKQFKYKARFDYDGLTQEKTKLLHILYSYLEKQLNASSKKAPSRANVREVSATNAPVGGKFAIQMEKFARENPWVVQYAVFKNLKDAAMQASWKSWDENLQHLSKEQIQLRWSNRALKSSHNFFVWCQMRAAEQFKESADYVRSLGITLKGDIPILMNDDSADCWALPEFFNQELRAGSPPDGENPVGQNWGFPTYSWDNLAKDDYSWWRDRVKVASQYYDAFRIDHVLGFFRIWAVPAKDTTAYLGHTIPCETISRQKLNEMGFDDGRLRWLSKPHVPTRLIEDITWNHDEAVADLSQVCDRLGNEELWLFKSEISSDGELYNFHFHDDGDKDLRVKQALVEKWRDRALIELSPDTFIPVYKYMDSTAWKTLSWEEQQKLGGLFNEIKGREDQLWKEQALNVLRPITKETAMTPCAEDLGVNLNVLPQVLNELNILSLKVVRWNRDWNAGGQPFYAFNAYPELSVATTSVHDSSTLRQWWNEEKGAVEAFVRDARNQGFQISDASAEFNEKIAHEVLGITANVNSAWFINPLQDYLFLNQKYYLSDPNAERINVPGSVNEFNWTYRLPVSVEDLSADEALIAGIKDIVKVHDR